jgi:hypothetical protein
VFIEENLQETPISRLQSLLVSLILNMDLQPTLTLSAGTLLSLPALRDARRSAAIFEHSQKEAKKLDHWNKRSTFFRVIAIARRLGTITGLLVGSLAYHHPVRASDDTVRPERVLSVVTADWNNDGAFDRALLIASETEPDEVDLLVYLSESTEIMRLAVSKKNIAWRGRMWGTQPALELTDRGSLVITSANEAIGRNRWSRKLTVVYRDKAFLVAGYTYTERDTLAPGAQSSCDINFLSGSGVKNKKPFKTTTKPVALMEWSEASIPQECR